MVKPDWGTKRICKKCAASFYDLNKTPIECPKCNTKFQAADFVSRYAKVASEGKERKESKKVAPVLEEEEILDDDAVGLMEDDTDLDEDVVEGIERDGDSDHE